MFMFAELFLIKGFWLPVKQRCMTKKNTRECAEIKPQAPSDEVAVHLAIKRDSLHEQF
jgi:hypothetical protein